MAIALHLKDYLAAQGIAYEVVTHPRATHMMGAAHKAHVPSDCVAKGVLLEDANGYVVAVVPASHHVDLGQLHRWLNRSLGLATEPELAGLFEDCELGAIPPVGAAYGLETIFDDSLGEKPDVYLEAGDHESLLHVKGEDFVRLMAGTKHARFSKPA